MTVTVTVRTPAKINLGLSVGAPAPDGWHPVATIYQAVSLYDEVKARPHYIVQERVNFHARERAPAVAPETSQRS